MGSAATSEVFLFEKNATGAGVRRENMALQSDVFNYDTLPIPPTVIMNLFCETRFDKPGQVVIVTAEPSCITTLRKKEISLCKLRSTRLSLPPPEPF